MWLLTLKSILVATDLSEASKPALATAARLAPLAGARLHLLHVTDAPEPDGPAALKQFFRRAVEGDGEPDTVQVVAGSPTAAIVEHAVLHAADAVILGPHRSRETMGVMGSTAAGVVRAAPCPCLVAATELELPLGRVLVPIDLSEIATGALSVALSWASALRPRTGRAVLTALHVDPVSDSSTAERRVREEIERARARAEGAAHVEIHEKIVRDPDATGTILRTAEADRADLLVMGTRGAAASANALGSVSAAVARVTPCPLLLVPPVTWEEHGTAG